MRLSRSEVRSWLQRDASLLGSPAVQGICSVVSVCQGNKGRSLAKRGLGSLLPGQAYVGRPGALGNPFLVGRDGSQEEVIAKYRRWLWELAWEGELALLCWCHPLPCHAEVVRGAVLWLAGVERETTTGARDG
ncbi:MAG: DUF4326 domain-containing protein [Cyanobacteriota bacterium]